MGIEPLNAGDRFSGNITINQRAATLPGNYLVYFSEHNWDKSAVCHVAVIRAVSLRVHR